MRSNPLFASRGFRTLWLARLVSNIGDGAALLALVLYVRDLERSGFAVAVLLIAQTVPRLLGPAAGALVDLVSLKRLMVACELSQVVIFGAIAAFQPAFAVVVALVLVASFFDTLFSPASASAVPALVERPSLMQANALLGTTLNLQVALGPLVAALAIAASGTRGALAVNAASFLLSGILLMTLPGLTVERTWPRPAFLRTTYEGVAYVVRTPVLALVVAGLFLFIAFTAVDNVALVFLTRDVLGASGTGFALTMAGFGVGMLVGSMALAFGRVRVRPAFLLVGAWVISGISSLGTGIAPTLGFAAAAQAVGGVANAVDVVSGETLIQQESDRAMLGRVFGFFSTAISAGMAVAYVFAGVMLAWTTPRITFVVAGVGSLVCTFVLGPFIVAAVRRGGAPEPA